MNDAVWTKERLALLTGIVIGTFGTALIAWLMP
jgi:hypothetical protein